MSEHDVIAIKDLIANAEQEELEQGHLRQLLQTQLPLLHSAIRLPESNELNTLKEFVVRYIRQVPDFIEAINQISLEAGIDTYTQKFLHIAKDYFLNPPALVEDRSGLVAMLDEAYLSQRLIEEINDRFIGHCGIPLAPMDMTRANLIIHHLIGEEFANQLDMAVQFSVEMLMTEEKVFENPAFKQYVDVHRERGWSEELERWPCLAEDLSIYLRFGF